jgi:hypothetical protein
MHLKTADDEGGREAAQQLAVPGSQLCLWALQVMQPPAGSAGPRASCVITLAVSRDLAPAGMQHRLQPAACTAAALARGDGTNSTPNPPAHAGAHTRRPWVAPNQPLQANYGRAAHLCQKPTKRHTTTHVACAAGRAPGKAQGAPRVPHSWCPISPNRPPTSSSPSPGRVPRASLTHGARSAQTGRPPPAAPPRSTPP